MWHYIRNNKQIGPVDENTIVDLIRNGTIAAGTPVWKEGMADWERADKTELSSMLGVVPPPVPVRSEIAVRPVAAMGTAAATYEPASLRVLWLWFAWLMALGTPLTFVFVGIPALIAAVVIDYVLLYRFWGIIQDGNVRTSPGKAVGFCFIPFFNIYWIYVAYVGLSKDVNAYCDERQIPGARVNEGLALTWYILSLVSIVPYVGILISIVTMILLIIMMKQFTDLSMSILEQRRAVSGAQGQGVGV